jgi:hypothetical protein
MGGPLAVSVIQMEAVIVLPAVQGVTMHGHILTSETS